MKTKFYKKQKMSIAKTGILILGFAMMMHYSFAQWTQVGSGPVTTSTHYTMDLAGVGSTPYVASITNDGIYKVSVFNLVGSNWMNVGPDGFSDDSCNFVTIASDGSSPYVAFLSYTSPFDLTFSMQVMKYNGSAWEWVGSHYVDSVMGSFAQLAIDGSTPYVGYYEATDTSYSNHGLSVKKFNGTSWEYVGNPIIPNTFQSQDNNFAVHAGTPWIAFIDSSVDAYSVKKWDGSQWVYVGTPGISVMIDSYPGGVDLAFKGDTAYMVVNNEISPSLFKLSLYKFNGLSWVLTGPADFSSGNAYYPRLEFKDGIPLVSYLDMADTTAFSVMKLEYGAWSYLDTQGELGNGEGAICLINNQPYAWHNNALGECTIYNYSGAVSVEDLLTDDQITVYPNPTTQYLTIAGIDKVAGVERISLINASGQTVYSQKGNFLNSTTIDCSSMQPGIYFIRLGVGDRLVSKKLIIQ